MSSNNRKQMLNSTFKIVFFIEVILITAIRSYYTMRIKKNSVKQEHEPLADRLFLLLETVGMIIPMIYVLSSKLDFANYLIPSWIGWSGTFLFGTAILLLRKSHLDLGKFWSMSFTIKSDHKLVKSGIYKYIRHPLYATHMIWAVAQAMMLNNWIAGYSFLIVFLPHYLYRVRIEEKMMIDEFGDEYLEYMKTTCRLVPKFLINKAENP